MDVSLGQNYSQPLQALILSIEMNNPWTFHAPTMKLENYHPPPPNRSYKHPPGTILSDMSSSTYSLIQTLPLPSIHRHFDCSNLERTFNAEDEGDMSQDSMTLSLAAATLVHAPSGSDYTDISMLHLHLFHSACSPISSSAGTHEEAMHAIVKSFHDLTELLKIRKGQERPRMPYHLATLEMMRLVLDRGDVVPD